MLAIKGPSRISSLIISSFIPAEIRGRHDLSKFKKLGYRWVLGTEEILEVGYRWVPGTEEERQMVRLRKAPYGPFNVFGRLNLVIGFASGSFWNIWRI